MKSIFYLVIAWCALSACTKNRTCTCSDGYSFTIKASKKAAQDTCKKYSAGQIECKMN